MNKIQTQILSATDTGLVREVNEDSCGTIETPNGILCVVCDGMGGHVGGAEASRIAVDCIMQHLSKEVYTDIKKALSDALDFANLQIFGTASENSCLRGMGTTACVLLVQDNQVWLAHVGDSRIYLYVAKENRLHRLTKDHSYVQGLIDQGIIYEEEAENHPDRNRILRALGIKEDMQADVAERPVLPAKGDIFLICSDGLSGMVSDSHMQAILSDKTGLLEKETALMTAAKSAGGTDNITFQLVKINDSPHKKSIFESKNVPQQPTGSKRSLLKYALLALACVIVLLAGIFIGRKSNQSQSEMPNTPAGSMEIINPQDTVLQQDTMQNNLDNQNLDSI